MMRRHGSATSMVAREIINALTPLSRGSSLLCSSSPILQRLRSVNSTALVWRYKSTSSKTETAAKRKGLHALMSKQREGFGSFADLSAHAGSMLTVAAYMNTDILALRMLAIASGVLFTSFNYFQPKPLWVPIKWNALLMTVNVYMVTALLLEKHNAENMPPERKRLYEDGSFDKRGFSKVQFMKLFDVGRLRVFDQELMSQENRELDKLYYIIDGNATVKCAKDGRTLGTITPHHFVGEMAFLVYYHDEKKDESTPCAKASANVFANRMVHAWEWDARGLAEALKNDRDLSNAFTSYCSHDLRKKLLSANAEGGVGQHKSEE